MSDPTSQVASPVDPDLEAGQVVGEYEVEAKIGQGGFGAVFKAVHPLIGKQVAIKVLARRFSVDPEMVARFVAEAKAVNQIRHRNIIDIFSFGQLPEGRHYYVMEFLDGEPLDQLLDRTGAMALAEALPVLLAIARAIDAAHGKGIAHRDLKPENVFLARDSDGGSFPKLLDFGIAKLLNPEVGVKQKTRTGMPLGTPYYMSPEQCRGKDVDHRTDFYAFGVLAHQMLTGTVPFDADDFMEIMMKQIGEQPPAASAKNPALPPGIDDTLAWLMAKDPAQRPPNLVTAVRAFEQSAEASGIALPVAVTSGLDIARTTPMPGSLTAPGRAGAAHTGAASTPKSRAGLYAAVIAALVVVGGGAVFVAMRGEATSPTPSPSPSPSPTPNPTPSPSPIPTPSPIPNPSPTAAAEAAFVKLDIDGVPDDTQVLVDGKPVGTAPGAFRLARNAQAVKLELRHAGYVSAVQPFVPDHDDTIHGALKKLARTPAAASGSAAHKDPHDIEDPFHR